MWFLFFCRMIVALIDDGVDNKTYSNLNVIRNLTVCDNGTLVEKELNVNLLSDHGTTCARIINKYAPETEFISIQVFTNHDGSLCANCDNLVSALKWCCNEKLPLIHMSLGTRDMTDYQKIRLIIETMADNRQLIVAAASNQNTYTIPACMPEVIGVRHWSKDSPADYIFRWYPFDGVDVGCCGVHMLDDEKKIENHTPASNSYAAPWVTAFVANKLIEAGRLLTSDEIRHLLFGNAAETKQKYIKAFAPYIWNYSPERIAAQNLYWDFNLYNKIIKPQIPKNHDEIDVPVIQMMGSDKEKIHELIGLFKKRFFDDRYWVCVVTEIFEKYASDYIPYPSAMKHERFLFALHEIYRPDLFITISRKPIFGNIIISAENGGLICNCREDRFSRLYAPDELDMCVDDVCGLIYP